MCVLLNVVDYKRGNKKFMLLLDRGTYCLIKVKLPVRLPERSLKYPDL